MKVLMLNGSCNERGCTYTALEEIGRTLREEGVDCEIFQLGADPVRDCTAAAARGRQRVFTDDGVNRFVEKARKARRLRLRHARLLRAPERARAVLPRPRVLQRQRRLRLQARRRGGLGAPRGDDREHRRAGEVLRHLTDADRRLDILEHGTRKLSRGRPAGSGGAADDAQPCPRDGVADAVHRNRPRCGHLSPHTRTHRAHQFHPLNGSREAKQK